MDPVDPRFALADSEFFDNPRRDEVGGTTAFEIPIRHDWTAWDRSDNGHWVYLRPRHRALPEQGWKIHLSATTTSAAELLAMVGTYCWEHSVAFKFIIDTHVLNALNAKDADRSASGKFVTVYPSSLDELHHALRALGAQSAHLSGPHILSDLRWHSGPVFVRFGGFRPLFVDVDGVRVAAIRSPSGDLEPDVRGTTFAVPPWVHVPDFLAPLARAYRDVRAPAGFPVVTGVLQFSNGGGIYEALDKGRAVVLKEGRPLAGITADGRDAATRITHEARVLKALNDARVVRPVRSFDVLGHHFLVTERATGRPLNAEVVARHPLIRADARLADVRKYRDWALTICRRVDDAVGAVHSGGYSHGDLHPRNFLMRGEQDLVLVDFEMARPLHDPAPAYIGAPGFVPNDGRQGIALDDYAVACIKLFLFLPLTPLVNAEISKAPELISWAQRRFDLPNEWASGVLHGLIPGSAASRDMHVSPQDESEVTLIASQLLADATPRREDRLWPGDPMQFTQSPFTLAHGALGPLLALHKAAVAIPPYLLEWALRSIDNETDPRPGLMDGLAGAALALHRLGQSDAAERALDRLLRADLRSVGPQLYGGLAGIGLVYLELSVVHPHLLPRARMIAHRLRPHLLRIDGSRDLSVATGAGGLMRGPSGVAIFLLRLYDSTGDEALLRMAADAIRADLRVCVLSPDGSLQVNEGWRVLPYLGAGAVGIGQALLQLLDRQPTNALREHLGPLSRAAHAELVVEPGLVQGRAGLIRYLFELDQRGMATSADKRALRRHTDLLSLHAIRRPEGIGYPGRGLLRRSCDFATGAAGILHTLATVHRDPVWRMTPPTSSLPSEPSQPSFEGLVTEGGETHGVPAFSAGAGAA